MPTIFPINSSEERLKVKAQLKEIYDSYRSAYMNCIYYQKRLKGTQEWVRIFEISLAILNSSAVASWAIWKFSYGVTTWAILSGLACILAVSRPFLKQSEEIERLAKQRTGYNDLFHDLKSIEREIQTNRCLSKQVWKHFKEVDERHRELTKTDDPDPSKKKLLDIMKQVNTEVPTHDLWYPKKK